VHIYVVDVYQMYMDVLADPAAYGYVNVTDGALYVGGDPDAYLWWDFGHATTGFNALIAEEAEHLLSHHRGGLRCNAK
jgi:phospholipase/lecithinase/hemolysin